MSEAKAFGIVRNIYGGNPKHERFYSEILLSVPVETTDDPSVVGYLSWDREKKNFKITINPKKIFDLFDDFINAPIESDNEKKMKKEYVIKQRKVAALRAVLKHEIFHYVLLHWSYKLDECERILANIAQDAAINSMISELRHIAFSYISPVTPHELISGKAPEKYILMNDPLDPVGSSWLDTFESLKKNFKCVKYIPDFGVDYDYIEGNVEDVERIVKRAAVSGDIPKSFLKRLRGHGSESNTQSVSRFVGIGQSRQITWTSILKKFFKSMRKFEWYATWKKSSKRYRFPPSMKFRYRESQQITVMVDVSGSVSNEELSRALAEVSRLAKLYEVTGWIYTYDVEIHDKIRLKDIKRHNIELHGAGGTSLEKALSETEDRLAKNVVIFTDGFDEFISPDFLKDRKFLFIYYPNHWAPHRMRMKSLGAWTAVLRGRG